MTATAAPPIDVGQPLRIARGLVTHLESGNSLPCLVGRELIDGEAVHIDVPVDAWWFGSAEATYREGGFIDPTSLFAYTLTASITTARIYEDRIEAEARTSLRWHRLGSMTTQVILTSERTLLQSDDQVLSVWHRSEPGVSPELQRHTLHVTPANTAPLCLTGPWVPYLAVAMLYSLRGEIPYI